MRLPWPASVVLAMTFAVLTGPPAYWHPLAKTKSVPVVVSWQGEVRMELRKEAPKRGYVTDGKTWERLWKAWRATEKAPSVNFKEAIVLVAANDDLNQISVIPAIDDKSDLKLIYESTLIGFLNPTEFAYQFALIKREGVKTIKGKAIEDE
ncbi:hypothetical protein [Fuerstiella marisgermanici]|uniref:Uncharacterized protein n=1 Tax=Fuerstiella marisgermanici TaxID=1891926 RepID=A0A1P8WDA8_9PLAN|nr:hypothetical protein [Fuerstiella marisgermanici]APZ92027.1 hypothetical protein Fuma_01628 [Fuerstiella marisgermanici]